MNHRIESMKPSASMVLMARAKEMQKTDPTVIGLAGGEPDFATPDRISMAAIRSLTEGYTHYVVGPGLPELRQAIQKKLREENDLDYDVNCIIVWRCVYGRMSLCRMPSSAAVFSNSVGRSRLLLEKRLVNSKPLSVWTHSTCMPLR